MRKVQNIAAAAGSENVNVNRSLITRWGGYEEMFAQKWVGVPVLFLMLYAHLQPYQLTVGEAMFAIQVMAFKWGDSAPWPSYKKLAERMGVSDKMVRRYAAQLEQKGYLKRQARIGSSNAFDFSGLFLAIVASASAQAEAKKKTA
jgi:hypothetical protein